MFQITKPSIARILAAKEITEAARMIHGMAGQINPRNIKPGRLETFDEARTRLRINNDEINAARLNHGRIFWVAFVFIFVAWNVRYLAGFAVGDVLATVGFTSICVSLMFRHSFRASQLKARKLHGVKEWASNANFWIPAAF